MGETSADDRIRFGIMGCAKIARKVARAINLAPNAVLHAIGSRSLETATRFATTVPGLLPEGVKLYGSYDQVLDDPFVDAVYMPLPTSLHLPWALRAAANKKHVLLEKPAALDVAELERILEACQSNGVQFMDGSMWLHHPRTLKINHMLFDSNLLGDITYIHSTSTMGAPPEFFENDIRVKAEMDGLGALGDLGWYCLGAVLWAKNYQLPTLVTALPGSVTKNSNGVILSCSASIQYGQLAAETIGIIHCSFLSNTSMELTMSGSGGSLNVQDLAIPYQEDSAYFQFTTGAKFADLHIGWNIQKPQKVVVSLPTSYSKLESKLSQPQEALMVEEFSRLVRGIKKGAFCPDPKWPHITRNTQLLLDAVKKSIDSGFKPVYFSPL